MVISKSVHIDEKLKGRAKAAAAAATSQHAVLPRHVRGGWRMEEAGAQPAALVTCQQWLWVIRA